MKLLPSIVAAALSFFALWSWRADDAGLPAGSQSSALSAVRALGITPEGLAIAGFTPSQASNVIVRAAGAPALVAAMTTAQAAFDQAAAGVTAATSAAHASPGSADAASAVKAADAALADARVTLLGARSALFAEVMADVPTQAAESAGVYASGLHASVPAEFRAVARGSAEWTAIQAALRAEARAARMQTALGAEHAALLASVRSDPAVQAAAASLGSSLPGLQAAFDVTQLPGQP